uniref:heme oxygenase (biliverdin-producing) n=1 Tax=Callorhinchus milii TaxID=7868 RepID=A0A4W3J9H1_CALMI
MTMDLCEALKSATKEAHERAENTQFMRNFQNSQISLEHFKLLFEIYYCLLISVFEELQRLGSKPQLSGLLSPGELHRVSALEADLQYLHGEGWREALRCPPATSEYVRRLRHVGSEQPELLGAHAYTRYMGDLSGGQVLRKLAQKALGLPASGRGTAFFTFPNISSSNGFKQLYRSRLDSLELSQQTRLQILDEANRAFQLNVEVFEDLQRLGPSALRNGSSVPEGGAEIRQRTVKRPLGDEKVRESDRAVTGTPAWPVGVVVLSVAVLVAAFLWFSL